MSLHPLLSERTELCVALVRPGQAVEVVASRNDRCGWRTTGSLRDGERQAHALLYADRRQATLTHLDVRFYGDCAERRRANEERRPFGVQIQVLWLRVRKFDALIAKLKAMLAAHRGYAHAGDGAAKLHRASQRKAEAEADLRAWDTKNPR